MTSGRLQEAGRYGSQSVQCFQEISSDNLSRETSQTEPSWLHNFTVYLSKTQNITDRTQSAWKYALLLSRKNPITSSTALSVAATSCIDASWMAVSLGKVARNNSMLLNFRSRSCWSRPAVRVPRTREVVSKALTIHVSRPAKSSTVKAWNEVYSHQQGLGRLPQLESCTPFGAQTSQLVLLWGSCGRQMTVSSWCRIAHGDPKGLLCPRRRILWLSEVGRICLPM